MDTGTSLRSVTKEVKAVRWRHGDRSFVLVDTPGFDDTELSEGEVFSRIAEFLQIQYVHDSMADLFSNVEPASTRYERRVLVNGIIYLYPISDNRMRGSSIKTLHLFRQLCGNDGLRNVILVTSMWDIVDSTLGLSRQKELEKEFWKPMMDVGSRAYAYQGRASAHEIVDLILKNQSTVLQIQRELVDQKRKLLQTEAGQVVDAGLASSVDSSQKQLERLQMFLEEAHQDSPDTLVDDLSKQRNGIVNRIKCMEANRASLNDDYEKALRALREEIRVLTQERQISDMDALWAVFGAQ